MILQSMAVEKNILAAYGPTRRFHFSPRLGVQVQLPSPSAIAAQCEVLRCEGGSSTAAWEVHEPSGLKIGVMVAGNSGRPGGSCGDRDIVKSIHEQHRTHEEDMFSNWILTEAGKDPVKQNNLYISTINKFWGMKLLHSTEPDTFQGVNYKETVSPMDFADAWVVRNTLLSVKQRSLHSKNARRSKTVRPTYVFDSRRTVKCTLVFCAGPNAAGANHSSHGSMARTFNKRAAHHYPFFRDCVSCALRAGLDAMINEEIKIAIVAKLSCGAYSGPHRRRINEEFEDIVNQLLRERLGVSTRGHYFDRVIVPELA